MWSKPASGAGGTTSCACCPSDLCPAGGRAADAVRHRENWREGVNGYARPVAIPWFENEWFESVAVAQRRAKRRLPKSVYGALIAGTERGVSMNDNLNAFDELGFRPITAGQPAQRDLATNVMGQPASMPVLISPTGVQAVHPDGEVAVARAAAARGVPMGLSSFASKPLSDVIAAQPQLFFQIYWAGDRDSMVARMERAKAAGACGMILTLDWSFVHSRDWGSPSIPQSIDVKTAIVHAPEVALRPFWLLDWVRSGKLPDLTVPNFAVSSDGSAPGFFEAYGTWMGTPPPTWEDVAWLRSQWDGPFMVKGIGRADEARRAVDAVGGQVEIVLDGGVRRGSDVVKALALGAQAVMIGRAYLWGLAANGQAGVENVLDVLRNGIESTMMGIGRSSIADLSPDDLVIPDGFSPPR